MNSSLYECRVMHHRLSPKEHRFSYKIFMFCLDLSELDVLNDRLHWFSRNRWNLYSFCDHDHLTFSTADIQENVREYVHSQGCQERVERVILVTLPRVLGYIFNPVSFYFCFGINGNSLCSVVEVGNTFRELKLFYLKAPEESRAIRFTHKETKYFYVSPFMDHNLQFAFDLQVPDQKMVMQIDDYRDSEKVLHTTLTGERLDLNDRTLLHLTWKYPLVTLKVIAGIHWEAWKLWRKGLPFHRKADHADLQREIHRASGGHHRG